MTESFGQTSGGWTLLFISTPISLDNLLSCLANEFSNTVAVLGETALSPYPMA